MNEKIKEAKELLKKEGYIIIKPSEQQKKDAEKCAETCYAGDCLGCSCSICIY